jgi:hypothetical protein
MINSAPRPHFNLYTLCLLLLSAVLLQGCGGARDEPFDGGGAFNSSNSSRGAAVTVDFLGDEKSDFRLPNSVSYNATHEVLRTREEFDAAWLRYYSTAYAGGITLDFTQGQVLLADQGTITVCDPQVERKSQEAYKLGEDFVVVTISFHNTHQSSSASANSESSSASSGSSSSSSCNPNSDASKHPFVFLYVHSRSQIVYTPDID